MPAAAALLLLLQGCVPAFRGGGSVDPIPSASPTLTQMNKEREPVKFSHSHVEEAVRAALKQPTGDIQEASLQQIRSLTLTKGALTHLGDLKGMSGLRSLTVTGNELTDLKGLSYAAGLLELDLSDNPIKDLTPIADLKQLKELRLNGNQIQDLSPLAGLTRLEILLADGNDIEDIRALSKLPNLVRLSLNGNRIKELGPLSGLRMLTILSLQKNRIVDLQALSPLPLEELYLSGNAIRSVEPLAQVSDTSLTRMFRVLDVANNPVEDYSPLLRVEIGKWVDGSQAAALSGPAAYTSRKYGFSLAFPGSWTGQYEVREVEEGIAVYYRSLAGIKTDALLFSILDQGSPKEWKEASEAGLPLEKVGERKGRVFAKASPSDDPGLKEAKDTARYRELLKEIPAILASFR